MNCVSCRSNVRISNHKGIHDSCLLTWQNQHDYLLFELFPSIFADKRLNRAQGLAIECMKCYRLAVPQDIWEKLSPTFKTDIRIYDTGSRRPVCNTCRRPKYRRNADTQLRQAERNFQKEPTRDRWTIWLREAARTGNFPFTSEGLAAATGGEVIAFEITEDGFEATVAYAEFPALEVSYNHRIGPDDYESESFPRGPFSGKISVQWHPTSDDDPVLYIEIADRREEEVVPMSSGSEEGPFTRMMYISGGEYHFVGGSVQNNEQLRAACHAPANEWESC